MFLALMNEKSQRSLLACRDFAALKALARSALLSTPGVRYSSLKPEVNSATTAARASTSPGPSHLDFHLFALGRSPASAGRSRAVASASPILVAQQRGHRTLRQLEQHHGPVARECLTCF